MTDMEGFNNIEELIEKINESPFIWVQSVDWGGQDDNRRTASLSWVPFSTIDQVLIESAFNKNSDFAGVDFGRKEVHFESKLVTSRFWRGCAQRVLRSLWCFEDHPYEEEDSAVIESWFIRGARVPLILPDGKRKVIQHASGEIYQYSVFSRSDPPKAVRRGGVFVPEAISEAALAEFHSGRIRHLVFAIHGIGETLWSKHCLGQPGIICSINSLRENVNKLTMDLRNSDAGRMEFLPLEWYHILHDDNVELSEQIKSITLPSIPLLRQFSNDALADMLFYTNEKYRIKILTAVCSQLNSLVDRVKAYNELGSDLPVSLCGHSLGSVIIYDLLQLQCKADCPPEMKLRFTTSCLFLFGSPLGLFLTVRGTENIVIPGIKMLNVFQPTDPVAYRLEPLLIPDSSLLAPKHVPHYSTGGIRTHVAVKNVANHLWNFPLSFWGGSGLSGAVSSLSSAVQEVTGWNPNEGERRRQDAASAALQDALPGGAERLDWVIQEASVLESVTMEYINAIASHCRYFEHLDVARFIMDQTGFLSRDAGDDSDLSAEN